jgi:DNA polymerase-1
MIELDRRLAAGFESKMILQVHDELLFEGPQKEIPRLTKLVKEVMEASTSSASPSSSTPKSAPTGAT